MWISVRPGGFSRFIFCPSSWHRGSQCCCWSGSRTLLVFFLAPWYAPGMSGECSVLGSEEQDPSLKAFLRGCKPDLQSQDGLFNQLSKHCKSFQKLFSCIIKAIIYSGSLPLCSFETCSEGPMTDSGEFITLLCPTCYSRVNHTGVMVI